MSILKAFDVECNDDAVVIKYLQQDGPPYLFAGDEYKPVGTRFELAGQPFCISRIATREEFDRRQARLGLNRARRAALHFFEAVTD